MNRYLPQYKELVQRHGKLECTMRAKGEYRATLRGADGRIKYESGWSDNTILDGGLYNSTEERLTSFGNGDMFYTIWLGDSAAAVDITQTGLQGNEIYGGIGETFVSSNTPSLPDYERISVVKWVFGTGVATGTIREFVIAPRNKNNSSERCTVRCVLDTEIIKGASDSLTMEHRHTFYPFLDDKTGVIDISGTNYNYILRMSNVDYPPGGHPRWYTPYFRSGTNFVFPGSIGALTDAGPGGGQWGSLNGAHAIGGTLGTGYYVDGESIIGVDGGTGVIKSHQTTWGGYNWGDLGIQWEIGKTSEETVPGDVTGSGLTKENTHEYRITLRTYVARYVP
jgi:hypothetical protein